MTALLENAAAQHWSHLQNGSVEEERSIHAVVSLQAGLRLKERHASSRGLGRFGAVGAAAVAIWLGRAAAGSAALLLSWRRCACR